MEILLPLTHLRTSTDQPLSKLSAGNEYGGFMNAYNLSTTVQKPQPVLSTIQRGPWARTCLVNADANSNADAYIHPNGNTTAYSTSHPNLRASTGNSQASGQLVAQLPKQLGTRLRNPREPGVILNHRHLQRHATVRALFCRPENKKDFVLNRCTKGNMAGFGVSSQARRDGTSSKEAV